MDNLDIGNSGDKNLDSGDTKISHSPLSLGGGDAVEVPKVEAAAEAVEPAKPIAKKAAEKPVSSERITGVKTFFTKLHAGAIEFLDGQITKWLSDNPGITIKRTDTVTGTVTGKKTEPNIIVTVWY